MRLDREHGVRALIADNQLLRALRQADLEFGEEIVLKALSSRGPTRVGIENPAKPLATVGSGQALLTHNLLAVSNPD